MSLRLRLTVWYVGLLAAILIAFGVGLYSIVSIGLYQQAEGNLQSRAADIQVSLAATLSVQGDPATVLGQVGALLSSAPDVFAGSDVFVQIAALDGDVISKSANLGNQRFVVDRAQLQQVAQGQAIFSVIHVNQTRMLAYVAPLQVNGRTVGIIELAQSLHQMDTTLAQLATLIAASIIAALVLAAFGGALLARQALAPIDRVTLTAQAITRARDLGRRIETSGASDEVGRLASTFNEMLSRIEDLFRAQRRFVADVSHELRTPLTVVRGNLDLLRRGAASDPVARDEALGAIDSEVARMSRMVGDLLLLARADAGVQMAHQPVELDTLLLDVYEQAHVLADGVKLSLGNEDQATIVGDRDRLKQVLLNLVDNAIKYTPGGGEVKLSLEKDADWVRIAVHDSGIGIAPENIPHLFDRFYRVDKARARDAGGAGLGLAIAKAVVDAHNGKITVESQPGQGSTFTVWLPVRSNGAGAPADGRQEVPSAAGVRTERYSPNE